MECRSCKETIAHRVSRCPGCHRPQARFRAWFSPQPLTLVAFALAGCWSIAFAALRGSVTELSGASIHDGGERLTLGELRFRTSEQGCDARMSLTGTLPIPPWRSGGSRWRRVATAARAFAAVRAGAREGVAGTCAFS